MPRTKTEKYKSNIMSINIGSFDGSPEQLDFFFENLNDLAEINRWSERQTILTLKTKLEGPARSYFLNCPDLQKSDIKLAEIKEKFRYYFRKPSQCLSQQEFCKIKLMQDESVMNLAHRLDTLVTKVFPNISDVNALNEIKLNQLIEALPNSIALDLKKEGINSYSKAIERAQALLEISQLNKNDNVLASYAINLESMSKRVNEIATMLQKPSTHEVHSVENTEYANYSRASTSKQKNVYKVNRQHNQFKRYKNINHSRPFSRNFNENNKRNVVCQYCDKRGHILKNCYQFKRLMGNKPTSQQFSNHQSNHQCNSLQKQNCSCNLNM